MGPHPSSPSKTFRSVSSTCVDKSWLAEVLFFFLIKVFCILWPCLMQASTWHIIRVRLEMPSLTARLSSPGLLYYQWFKAFAQLGALAAFTCSWLQETLLRIPSKNIWQQSLLSFNNREAPDAGQQWKSLKSLLENYWLNLSYMKR